jgi:hypothetical protein
VCTLAKGNPSQTHVRANTVPIGFQNVELRV